MSRCVIVQTAYLGDVILTTPLIRAAGARHDSVSVITTPSALDLLAEDPHVDEVIPFDKRSSQKGLRGLGSVAADLRERDFDTAYLPHRSIRSALAIRLAGIPERIGFRDSPARWHYTRSVEATGEHESERTLSLIEPEGDSRLHLGLTDEDREMAAEALQSRGIGRDTEFAVLAPGSVWETKRWPYFAELAVNIGRRIPVVVIGVDGDSLPAPTSSIPIVDLCGKLPIRASAAVIERSRLAVTNDSAPLHMAQAVDSPTVAIFGATSPEQGFGPRSPRDVVLGLDMECRPCSIHGSRSCPLTHHNCMRALSADVVTRAVLQMVEANS